MTVRNELSEDELRATLSDLLDGWRRMPDYPVVVKRVRPVSNRRIAVVAGLAAHAHKIAEAAATLIDAGMVLESMPTVRATLEHAVTSHWIFHYEDEAVAAFLKEGQRQDRNVATTIKESGWPGAETISGLLDGPVEWMSTGDEAARRFDKLCADLVGGASLYALYRILSGMSHPTPGVVERYMAIYADDRPFVLRLNSTPLGSIRAWLWILCASCVWAGRAVDMSNREHPRREELRKVARALSVPDTIKLTDQALIRRQQGRAKKR